VLIYIIYFNDAKKTPFRFYLVDLNR
jgi:hypothetical protein